MTARSTTRARVACAPVIRNARRRLRMRIRRARAARATSFATNGYIKQGGGCVVKTALMFVTSTHSTGNLGGLSGGRRDMSGRSRPPPGRIRHVQGIPQRRRDERRRAPFVHSTRPYALVNGTVIAANYAGLTSGACPRARRCRRDRRFKRRRRWSGRGRPKARSPWHRGTRLDDCVGDEDR